MTNPVQGNSVAFPPLQSPLVDSNSYMTTPWYLMFRALFNRTGGGTGAPSLVPQNVQDAGAGQASAAALIPGVAFVTASGKGVGLSAQQAGQYMIVFNITAGQHVNVYPPAGAQINALGVNAPYVLATGCQIFFWQSATQLRTMTLV